VRRCPRACAQEEPHKTLAKWTPIAPPPSRATTTNAAAAALPPPARGPSPGLQPEASPAAPAGPEGGGSGGAGGGEGADFFVPWHLPFHRAEGARAIRAARAAPPDKAAAAGDAGPLGGGAKVRRRVGC
jgi:hypothetical protein